MTAKEASKPKSETPNERKTVVRIAPEMHEKARFASMPAPMSNNRAASASRGTAMSEVGVAAAAAAPNAIVVSMNGQSGSIDMDKASLLLDTNFIVLT